MTAPVLERVRGTGSVTTLAVFAALVFALHDDPYQQRMGAAFERTRRFAPLEFEGGWARDGTAL